MAEFIHQPLFETGADTTVYRQLDLPAPHPERALGRNFIQIQATTLRALAREAFEDVSHLLRTAHLEKVAAILHDPEASENDRFVATELLKNAAIAAEREFPSCQDTGTAIVMAHKGDGVLIDGDDEAALAQGIADAYRELNLRYSQVAPLSMYEEKNTGTNLPAQIDIYSGHGAEYELLFIAKGGGSANKSYLFQKSKALLNPAAMEAFVKEALTGLGTAACPPYHLALVIGGTSAEMTLKTVKLASCGYYDTLPGTGNAAGRAFRDRALEQQIEQWGRETGIGAQFGGKYLLHDVRVIRLPRHGASCPVGIGVSCSADRQIRAKINAEGVFLEQLEQNPRRLLPTGANTGAEAVAIDLRKPMEAIRATLHTLPIGTRVTLTGPMVVARDIAHAKLKERLDTGKGLPDYLRQHPIYYAGPAKTPKGHASGSFGPTTSQRMDPYVPVFQRDGASLVMLGKGNRSPEVARSCKEHGGFYLGSIGGPAARLGRDCIRKVEVLEYPELGMEAIWKIEVENFPAFLVCDDKGNDLYASIHAEE